MAKCWRCGEKVDNIDIIPKIINMAPHAMPGLDIKLRVPANICGSCVYALQLKCAFNCEEIVLRKRIARMDK